MIEKVLNEQISMVQSKVTRKSSLMVTGLHCILKLSSKSYVLNLQSCTKDESKELENHI